MNGVSRAVHSALRGLTKAPGIFLIALVISGPPVSVRVDAGDRIGYMHLAPIEGAWVTLRARCGAGMDTQRPPHSSSTALRFRNDRID